MVIQFFQQLNYTSIAIISAIFGSFAMVLARVLLKGLRTPEILGVNFFTMGIILILVSPIFYQFNATPFAVLLIILIALIDTAANYFFFKTFEQTEASIASPILSLAPAFTFIFSYFTLSDVVSIKSLIIAILIIVSIIIFSVNFADFQKFKSATLFPALASSVLFGISAIPSKYLLSSLHAINAPTLYMFRAGFIALFSLLLFNFAIHHITVKQYRIIFLRSLIVIAQWILLYYALVRGNAGVTVTLANITPIFVFILGVLFLKEKITIKKAITAALVLIFSIII